MAFLARRLTLAMVLALLLVARSARADDAPPSNDPSAADAPKEAAPYLLTIRGTAGLGAGQTGLAARAGLSGEVWFSDLYGVGAFGGGSGQGTFCMFCATKNETMQLVGASFAARSAPRGSYGMLAIGAGYAWGRYWETGAFNLLGGGAPAPPDTKRSGVLLDLTGAWLFHAGPLEVGPAMHLDITTWGAAVITVNLAVGLAIPGD